MSVVICAAVGLKKPSERCYFLIYLFEMRTIEQHSVRRMNYKLFCLMQYLLLHFDSFKNIFYCFGSKINIKINQASLTFSDMSHTEASKKTKNCQIIFS